MAKRLISIRFDTELLDYLQERAEQDHRSLSNMITTILLKEKEQYEKSNDAVNYMDGMQSLDSALKNGGIRVKTITR